MAAQTLATHTPIWFLPRVPPASYPPVPPASMAPSTRTGPYTLPISANGFLPLLSVPACFLSSSLHIICLLFLWVLIFN